MVATRLELHPGSHGQHGGGHLSLKGGNLVEEMVSELSPEQGRVIIATTFIALTICTLASSCVQR